MLGCDGNRQGLLALHEEGHGLPLQVGVGEMSHNLALLILDPRDPPNFDPEALQSGCGLSFLYLGLANFGRIAHKNFSEFFSENIPVIFGPSFSRVREVLNGVGADGVGVKFPIFPVNCSYLPLVLG